MAADPSTLDWTPEGVPRSLRFDDIYFSRENGLDEARAVFLGGCDLPQAWAGRSHFTVAELGFGVGLNILALLDLWRRTRPQHGRLSMFSVEAFLLTREEAGRALAAWPELADLAAPLLAAWPRRAPGLHRIDFPDLHAVLDLHVGEALAGLEDWTGAADAWFLDGFSPAKNPDMWRPELLAAVAARSAPGARAGTFTVAGAVRRGLADAGFQVSKQKGHGGKRERLEARLPGDARPEAAAPCIAIIGAGIAGAALTRALNALGVRPLVVERAEPGAGASGNPAALVTPALDAGGGPRARFYAQAFARAVDLYRALGPDAVIAEGVLQREKAERDGARFDTVAASGVFAEEALERRAEGLLIVEGLVVRPRAVLARWLADADLIVGEASALRRDGDRWRVEGPDGRPLCCADAVVLANGLGADALAGGVLGLEPVRGQASWTKGLTLDQASAWGGYAIPMDEGILFGATHDRGRVDTEATMQDHARNLETLGAALPHLAQAAGVGVLGGRASVRASTADRMPLVGPAPGMEGVHILAGLGSRGFVTAPLLAEHLAAGLVNTPSPLGQTSLKVVGTSRLRKK